MGTAATTDEVRNVLVDLRAIARGNHMKVTMRPERPERRAPVQVAVRVGGVITSLQRGGDPIDTIRALIRALEKSNVTRRAYEDD